MGGFISAAVSLKTEEGSIKADNLLSTLAVVPVGSEYSRRLRKIAMMETVDSRELENVAGLG